MTERKASMRIGTAERVAAQRALQEHLNAGRLPVNEYAERTARADSATLAAELAELFSDLPGPHPKLPGIPSSTVGKILRKPVFLVVAAVVLVGAMVAVGLSLSGGPAGPSTGAAGPAPTASPPTSLMAPTDEGGAQAASPSATTAGAEAKFTIRRQTSNAAPLRMDHRGRGPDIDSIAPDWGIANGDGRDIGFGYYGSGLIHADAGASFSPVSGSPDPMICLAATEQSEDIHTNIDPNSTYCMRTSEGRLAWLVVVDAGNRDPYRPVVLQVTVWDPPAG
jgi:hypothetical protein